MEEEWRDFPNLQYHLTNPPISLDHRRRPTTAPLQGINLHDFLAGSPRDDDAPPLTTLSLHSGHLAFEPATQLPRKRPSDLSVVSEAPDGGRVRLKQRMIKNRESAARSRARKQAYINELEMEVAHLAEENADLRRQHHELKAAMAEQAPAKGKLQRTSSAPL
ncbi:hypothetical protein HPP92_012946 [Vanilla planifolia]|uniref:BZIP domain-containing protein n=1 Tax=Vanilla planifolia TaxID=51239 RepID=A0A835QMH0_VANPL|nr:hypothetical protein HPP92_012946 [Vanilla planifolia]